MISGAVFSIKGAGKIILFFLCSFVLAVCLSVLFVIVFSGITFQSNPWSEMLLQTIPIFLAYLISGFILKCYTKDWNVMLYFVVAGICGLINYLFGFETLYSAADDLYVRIQSLHYIAPVLGVILGAVVLGNSLVTKTDLAK